MPRQPRDEKMVDFSVKAKALLQVRGWTQAELVRRLEKVTGREWQTGNVSREINGDRPVTNVGKLMDYADAFEVPVSWFFGDSLVIAEAAELVESILALPPARRDAMKALVREFATSAA